MSVGFARWTSFSSRWAAVLFLLLGFAASAQAQVISQAVGGVYIDTKGVLRNSTEDDRGELRAWRQRAMAQMPVDIRQPDAMRKVSLKGLEAAIVESQGKGQVLPPEIRFLAGLQRVEYVFVYPETQDIVLAGFGEGFKVNAAGAVVGVTTERPVLMLEDLLVALRTAHQAAQGGISCSIDPTPEGLQRLKNLSKSLGKMGPDTVNNIEQQLGPQIITVSGIPADSHFARVLVAADYRMKRIAMNLDKSPVSGLHSYLDMVAGGGTDMMPRWWMAANYEPLVRSPDGLAWGIRGQAVKTLTESDVLIAGQREHTGKANPVAQKWADLMTKHFDDLCRVDATFGDLRNCMDLAVVGALIAKEDMGAKSGFPMSVLLDPAKLPLEQYAVAQQVDSKASVLKKGKNWIIATSGGVQIDSWGSVEHVEQSPDLGSVREKAATAAATNWWWK